MAGVERAVSRTWRGTTRRRGRHNVGQGALTWLACARCGADVWAPEDTAPVCDRCTLRLAIRAAEKPTEPAE